MNNEIQIFKNDLFGEIRTTVINDKPYFVGKDVAIVLGYSNTNDVISQHVDNEDKVVGAQNATPSITDSLGRAQYPTWINESGVYALIFGSKLKTAKQFKHWVTSEVLPSIRNTGQYNLMPKLPDFKNPAEAARAWANQYEQIEEQNKQIEALNDEVIELKKKTDYLEVILQSKETVTIGQIAADYGMTPQAMNNLLNKMRIQHKVNGQWLLYAEYLSKGYVHSETINVKHNNGRTEIKLFTRWRQSGRLFLYNKLKECSIIPLIER